MARGLYTLDRSTLYDRTARNSYGSYRLSRRRRRWESVSWWLSSIFVIALVAWALTWWFGIRGDDGNGATAGRVITFEVTSSENGQPLAGALVNYPGGSVATDSNGEVALAFPDEPVDLEITAPGYEPVYGTAGLDIDDRQRIAMNPAPQPSTDAGQVSAPTVESTVAESTEPTATTAPEPSPTPETAVSPTPSAEPTQPATGGNTISGIVTNAAGEPIWDATILSGSNFVRTGEDGRFTLANVPAGSEIEVWASGYKDLTLASSDQMEIKLERHNINAAYLTGAQLGNEATIQNIIDLAQTTDINAVVIDMKEGTVYYDTDVQFFIDANAVMPAFDPAALVQRFRDAGLYTIARIVVFNDPVVAENRTDLAIKTTTGDVWRGWNGAAWVNPYHQELWQPNIDLGIEAAAMGFDEVQYDYVRFPSDGDLSIAEFGTQYTYQEDERVQTIVDFLTMARDQLTAHGVKTAADVFAIVAIFPDDQGIGQRFADFTAVVDYICPMIYPSHFTGGPLGMADDAAPNANPFDTVLITMNSAAGKVPGQTLKIRPWIQDFTMGDPPYGVVEVQAQIDAALQAGGSGWMLWNPDSSFTVGALGDGSGENPA
jgi:hypothetical protein